MKKTVRFTWKSIICLVMALCLAIPSCGFVLPQRVEASTFGAEFTCPENLYLIYSTEYAVVPGVIETQYVTNVADGSDQEMGYALTIDLTNPAISIAAGYQNYDGTEWGMQTVREQAYAAEKATGNNVVAAVNADFFNMATGCPSGPLVMNGVTYHKSNSSYFAILKDGTAAIRSGGIQDDVLEAVGGSVIMLVDGEIPENVANNDSYNESKAPRTAAGIKADGSVVLFVGDGRQYPKSDGLTIYELAKMMQGLGCATAINLDGGGSTTFLTEREGESNLVVHNSPSDGHEREVSSSVLVFCSVKPDGIFDHAVLEPNNNAYTPYSTVEFSAIGVDKAGYGADMPEGLTYALAEDSLYMGTITEDGVFTSNGALGTARVQLMDGNKVVGSTTIDVIVPDQIGFANEELSFGFSQSSDLGLVVKAGGRDIIFSEDDFIWTMSDPSMGSFNGNIFTSSDSATVTGTITCEYKLNPNISGSVTAIIGKLPTIVWDFENPEDYVGLYTSNYSRGGVQSAEIVSIDDDEPVRFGKGSLKLNYNFINCGAVTEGACVGMTDSIEIPGVPTAIGVWVYAPEGTATTSKQRKEEGLSGFWLRGYFTDGAGRQQAFDYTLEPKQVNNDLDKAGIYWEGWQYCEADLTKYAAPYSIEPGMTFRLMYVAGTKMGTKTAGSIYFDNLQFVYGANIDDIDVPVIDTIKGNDIEITDGMVFDTNTVTFSSTFHDIENKYTTGIDYDVVRMYIDGVNVVDDSMYVLDQGGNQSWFYDVKLANGEHSIKMLIRDGFGNETTETRFFTVAANDNEATTVTLAPAEGTAPVLGRNFTLNLTSNDIADITAANVGIKVGDDFTLESVEFAPGFSGTYSIKSKVITINATGSAASDSNVIAYVTFNVPADLSSSIAFTYYTTLGSFDTVSATDKSNSFAVSQKSIKITAPLEVVAETIIVGCETEIAVIDTDKQPVAGASIYQVSGSGDILLGTTDENGVLVTSALSSASGQYTVYASADGEISYTTFVYAVNAVGTATPYDIISTAVVEGNSSKSFSWFSNVLESEDVAIAQVATAQAYAELGEEAFADYVGTTNDRVFTSGSASGYSIVRVSSVDIDNLTAGESYVYRVGDGINWSDVAEFEIDDEDGIVNFFIIGDIQAKDLENNTKIINRILNSGVDYTFGLQTGDAVDGGAVYSYWNELLKSFDENGLQNIDMIHVLGNHEYEGDGEAANSVDIYNLPGADCYSLEYDNVYIAVINYKSADNSVLKATGEWLVEDASKSDAQWKLLAMHQPPYYTNVAGGGEFINKNLPPYIEAAGINMVFSGHDHTLARTLPMIGGEVVENGVVYYICGSTGEKSYAAFNTPEFNFAYTSDSFDAVYTVVQINKLGISVVNYNIDGSVLDSYTLGEICSNHEYVYSDGDLVCTKCGEHKAVGTYSGLITDAETGKLMYLYLGVAKTGLVDFGEVQYLFDENGLGIDGEYRIDRMTYTADNGIVVDKNGIIAVTTIGYGLRETTVLRLYIGNKIPSEGWIYFEGNWYYCDGMNLARDAKTINGVRYRFNSDGTHTEGTFKTNNKGTKYYFAGEIVKGLVEYKGDTYYMDSKGVMVTNKTVEIDGFIYTFDENGIAVSIVEKPTRPATGLWIEDDKTYYYIDDVMVVNSWIETENGSYYFGADGAAVTKTSIIDNAYCIFNVDGTLASKEALDTYNGFLTISGKTYFYVDGSMMYGWQSIDGNWYYFEADGAMRAANKTIDGIYYKFNSDGTLKCGTWKASKGKTKYYVAGKYATGLTEIDGATYLFSNSGELKVNATIELDGIIYTTDETGIVVSSEIKPTRPATGLWTDGGKTYYYIDDVMVVNSWIETENGTYYFGADGAAVTKTSIIDNAVCTFNADGTLALKESLDTYDGFLALNGKTYLYVDGNMMFGWQNISDDWYYFEADGAMRTTNKTIDGIYYQFSSNGTLKCGTWKTSKGKTKYYVAGKYATGLTEIDGATYLFSNSGELKINATVELDGIIYTTDENGIVISSEIKPTRPATGLWVEGGKTYYYIDDVMVVNSWIETENGTYYFGADGAAVTKTSIIDNAICNFNADGTLASKESLDTYNGFLTLNGKTYFYVEGTMIIGWKNINGGWYYFNTDGTMVTGSKTINGIYYHFSSDGQQRDIALKTSKGITKGYLGGSYVTGFQTINGNLYYFSHNNGVMVKDEVREIDGVTYSFDADGIATVVEEEPIEEEPIEEEPIEEEPIEKELAEEEPIEEEPIEEEPAEEEPEEGEPIEEEPAEETEEEETAEQTVVEEPAEEITVEEPVEEITEEEPVEEIVVEEPAEEIADEESEDEESEDEEAEDSDGEETEEEETAEEIAE